VRCIIDHSTEELEGLEARQAIIRAKVALLHELQAGLGPQCAFVPLKLTALISPSLLERLTIGVAAADEAVAAAGRVLKETPAAAVKLEGAEPETLAVIDRLVRSGIPVMGHIGLTPQSVHQLGYRRQGNTTASQEALKRQAFALDQAGCFALVLEHIPSELAGELQQSLAIPVIGIGAGELCDGQVRVTADLLGLTSRQPPFSPPLIPGRALGAEALRGWIAGLGHPAAPATKPTAPAAPHC
jgi:3-methyl-2-oxobutanoate hydroxymethyltransferase